MVKKDWLEESHQPPEWFDKGRQINFPDTRLQLSIESGLHSTDSAKKNEAVERLFQSFNYRAWWTIQAYFKFRPRVRISFESIYFELLEQEFPDLIQNATEKNCKYALTCLYQHVSMGPRKNLIQEFEKRFVRKQDRTGVIWSSKSHKDVMVVPNRVLNQLTASVHAHSGLFERLSEIKGMTLPMIEILELRYGESLSLKQVGERLNKSHEWVRTWERRAIRLLGQPKNRQLLGLDPTAPIRPQKKYARIAGMPSRRKYRS